MRYLLKFLICGICLSMQLLGQEPIRVGVLHSDTGHLAMSERPVIETLRMAIKGLQEEGGLLGRDVTYHFRDGASNPDIFAKQARALILEDKVDIIFGCWSSSSRKKVIPVLEELNGLMFYSVQFEGLEDSPNVIYLGSTTSQQIVPAVRYFLLKYGLRFYFLGSDYVYSHTAHEIVKDRINIWGGKLVGASYAQMGATDFSAIIADIKQARPDFILNTIAGDSNKAFFEAYTKAGFKANELPVLSSSIGEPEIYHIGIENLQGHYATWSWFADIDTDSNRVFKAHFLKEDPISDPMATTWFGLRIWVEAVKATKSTDHQKILDYLSGRSFLSPNGMTYIDPDSHFAWNPSFIGKVNERGAYDMVWSSRRPHPPKSFPKTRTREAWQGFLDGLYKKWGNHWQNHGAGE